MEPTYKNFILNRKNKLKNRGYDWRGNIFRKFVSNYLFSDDTRIVNILMLERLLNYILDYTKMIKKSYMWIYDKSFRDFN